MSKESNARAFTNADWIIFTCSDQLIIMVYYDEITETSTYAIFHDNHGRAGVSNHTLLLIDILERGSNKSNAIESIVKILGDIFAFFTISMKDPNSAVAKSLLVRNFNHGKPQRLNAYFICKIYAELHTSGEVRTRNLVYVSSSHDHRHRHREDND